MTHRISIADTDVAFDCAPGQTVLDAALHNGIELPYSCRKGVCGNCAGAIAAGTVGGVAGAAIRNETCRPDQVLYCACEPVGGDVVLRPTQWKRIDPSARKTLTVKVHGNDRAAPDVSVIRLRLPAGQRAKFQAGQYLQVRLDEGDVRSYSMANPPQESDSVTLHVRHVPGGRFTAVASALKPGDTLRIELPFGGVALDADDPRPLVCVAGGTGFAPVKSILDDIARRKIVRPIALVWGARDPSGLYLPAAVEKWRRQWPDFVYVPALSEAAADAVPGAFAGRADDALRGRFDSLAGCVMHCCGSPAMVAAVRVAALEKGLSVDDFHADVFVPSADPLP
ncbi:FAD-binding oxidoreductase [uncultured Xylophilus sp.]|uniref:FAD-binding oxidoreductase n=1 Tax=uncultured Xylophilus sp. TaxID=296832 RepID=UPI0025D686CF|nr:FAD-binding oxidoreductase [uncultured Xylophilus sp.]